ncbi:MAG TPA: HesA/MoeB/ThiF family protein [candidate division WOR-3 bacterium]|uniref:HesA/MoeB/ThiF family protein n=1 Tax=candidate division WOR-3 bacterium TaxID=2052148 RepID=A0A7V5LUS0_UNCW3|nr:HesA/MoeB/ThiF family protein [candidate division WOR-3 bacterium]
MRYRRQKIIHRFNQDKLKNAHVAVLGSGGLGSAALYYLVAAGVGKISFYDADRVEESNLNRQILHFTSNVGMLKVDSALSKLKDLNPEIDIEGYPIKIDSESVKEIGKPDIIVDALDNFETRFVLNDYAVKNRIPFVHAAVESLEGRLSFVVPFETPCLRCIYKALPPRREIPVLGATAGILGTMEAMEVIKFLTGIGNTLKGRMAIFNFKTWDIRIVYVEKDPYCNICGMPR